MIYLNKINIFYIFLILINVLLLLTLNNFNFKIVNLLCPILNFISVLIILIILIFKIRNNNKEIYKFDNWTYTCLFVFFLTINTIFYGNNNIEFYAFNLISSIEYIKNLLNLKLIIWSDSRSLGIPMPIIPSLHFNPLLYFGYFFNLKVFYVSLFITHSFLGILYIIKISDLFLKNYYLKIFNGFLFAFSAPLINYMISDDWTASFISYSLLPLLIYIFLKILSSDGKFNTFSISLYSLFITYYYYNANPSFHIFLFFILFIFTIFYFIFKIKIQNYYNIFIIFLIVLILIIPNIIHVLIEVTKFKYDYETFNRNKFLAIHWFRLIDNLYPFISIDGNIIKFNFFENLSNLNFIDSAKIIIINSLNHGYRTYFLGFIYFVLSIVSIFYLLGQNQKKIKILKIFFIIFIVSLILMHFKSFYFFNLIDENYYGIIFIFIGLILSTYVIEKLNIKRKNVVTFLIFLQGFQVLAYSSLGIFILKNGQHNINFSTDFFNQDTDNLLFEWIEDLKIHEDKKVLFSPLIEQDLNKEYPVYKNYNLYSLQDFYYKKQIRVINDSFLKGISYDKILVSRSKKSGNLDFNHELFLNKDNLDILGADIIILKEQEIKRYPFIKDLKFISSIELSKLELPNSSNKIIQNSENVNLIHKFDKFFHFDKEIIFEKWYAFSNKKSHGDLFAISYPYIEVDNYFMYNIKCFDISFLCQNNLNLKNNKIVFKYSLNGRDGNYRIKFNKTKEKIIIVFNKIYRNEWKAYNLNKSLLVFPINNSLVGIEIPIGVNEIKIKFENQLMKILNYISIVTLLFLIISMPFSYIYSKNNRLYKSD